MKKHFFKMRLVRWLCEFGYSALILVRCVSKDSQDQHVLVLWLVLLLSKIVGLLWVNQWERNINFISTTRMYSISMGSKIIGVILHDAIIYHVWNHVQARVVSINEKWTSLNLFGYINSILYTYLSSDCLKGISSEDKMPDNTKLQFRQC